MTGRGRGPRASLAKARVVALVGAVLLGGHASWAGELPAKSPVKIDYSNGFKFTSGDGAFSLRLTAGLQGRFTYTDFDRRIAGNQEDVANFFLRRARLWWEGHAFSPEFTYSFHVQLEPTSAVNLHDAWLQYAFSDAFRIGFGRSKIPYGVEFLNSAMSLNFIERSIMYGETDISAGSGATWPGGGTAPLPLSGENQYTGFPTGGLCLFRSQGVALSGKVQRAHLGTLAWETGVWNGRNTRGLSNSDRRPLLSARLAYFPGQPIDLVTQGDLEPSPELRLGVVVSLYRDGGLHTRDAAGQPIAPYTSRDVGHNLGVLSRWRGWSGDVEWGRERYTMDRPEPGPWRFEREGWRASFGYFVVPGRVEVVGRTARLQRLRQPTAEAAQRSGLGLARVESGGAWVNAVEKVLNEVTLGGNLYFGHGHQHKLFFDLSRLSRRFDASPGPAPAAQRDRRLRTMLQFRF